jgi:hypothetical protein
MIRFYRHGATTLALARVLAGATSVTALAAALTLAGILPLAIVLCGSGRAAALALAGVLPGASAVAGLASALALTRILALTHVLVGGGIVLLRIIRARKTRARHDTGHDSAHDLREFATIHA